MGAARAELGIFGAISCRNDWLVWQVWDTSVGVDVFGLAVPESCLARQEDGVGAKCQKE